MPEGYIAREQSSGNWGFCRQQGRYSRKLPHIVESLRISRIIDRTIEGDAGFRQAGIVYLAKEDKAAAAHEKWLDYARAYQRDTRMITHRNSPRWCRRLRANGALRATAFRAHA
jgi:glycine/D-amino acid oxidase-like deaminating enzyme